MSNRRKKKMNYQDHYWQSAALNSREYFMYQQWILSLCMNRFRWEGLPDTCDERYLEFILATQGSATIALAPDINVWVSTQCTGGIPNIYDDPTTWQSIGTNGWCFDCSPLNGVIVWDNVQRFPIWNNIEIWARRLADYDRTLDLNLAHQKVPWVFSAPQEKVLDVTNILKQALGGEPAVLGYDSISNVKVDLLTQPVEFKGEEIQSSKAKVWNEIYTFLGIQNVDRKAERMVEAEVAANDEPTNIRALDGLNCRRRAADYLNKTFGLDIHVYWNYDNESDAYNLWNNPIKQLQLGVDEDEDKTEEVEASDDNTNRTDAGN